MASEHGDRELTFKFDLDSLRVTPLRSIDDCAGLLERFASDPDLVGALPTRLITVLAQVVVATLTATEAIYPIPITIGPLVVNKEYIDIAARIDGITASDQPAVDAWIAGYKTRTGAPDRRVRALANRAYNEGRIPGTQPVAAKGAAA